MRSEVVRRGQERLRVGPWRGDHRIAFLAPIGDGLPPTTAMVRHAVEVAQARGFEQALTGALSERERAGFERAGFEPREELHLLAHDLRDIPPGGGARTRRGWRIDRERALAVDAAAFPPFWRLDRDGLRDAIGATPVARFRIAPAGHDVVGYAVTGRAAGRGYVQRLAVHPDHTGEGIGRTLVVDGLHWLRAHRAHQAVVNTQRDNERALDLYQRLGFCVQPSGLLVLALAL